MKHARCALALACYYVGNAASHLLNRLPQADRWEWLSRLCYPLYNRPMLWSSQLDTGDCGIWEQDQPGRES